MKLSVLMPVYARDESCHLERALESLCQQTMPATEVVVVEDGPIGVSLQSVIEEYSMRLPVVRVKLPKNEGLGTALSTGLSHCTAELIARMDADDICLPIRFETQAGFLAAHEEIDVLGSAIAEFDNDISKIEAVRRLPRECEKVAEFAKTRNPLNHMTVMFRKTKVLQSGGYQTARGFEDYHLWARMLMMGCRLHNLSEVLVLARCGAGMQSRRGGLRYAYQDVRFQLYLRKIGYITGLQCLRNILLRAPIRLLPGSFRGAIYRILLRDRGEKDLVQRYQPPPELS